MVTRFNTRRDEQASAIQSPPLLTLAKRRGAVGTVYNLAILTFAHTLRKQPRAAFDRALTS